jgi:hypothetical protein
MKLANASVDRAKPGGTGIPADSNSPRDALLPPKALASELESSVSGRV